jgi:hypothetical protein
MSQGSAAAPASPLEILFPSLAGFCVPRPLCQISRKDATFQQIQFQCQRLAYVRDIAQREQQIPISINALARAFNCLRSSVQLALAYGLELPGERGKHTALDRHREQQILDWIQQNAEQSTLASKTEIKDSCTGQLKVPITRGWVNSFVLRYAECSSREHSMI